MRSILESWWGQKIDAYTYKVDLNACIGTVPNGGYAVVGRQQSAVLVSCGLEYARAAPSLQLSPRGQPDTLTAHFEYLNRTSIGSAIIIIEDVKLGQQLSRDLRNFAGITIPTCYEGTPAAALSPLPGFDALKNSPSGPDVVVNRPGIGTVPVVEHLDDAGFKSIFFVVNFFGYRKIYEKTTRYPDLIRSMYSRGHQVTLHTWTHLNMGKVGKQAYIRQMLDNEKALAQVLDTIPSYMRPPFGSCSDECLKEMGKLWYDVTHGSIDTNDFEHDTKSQYNVSIETSDKDLEAGGTVALTHNIKFYTADKMVPHMIAQLERRGPEGVTFGECLGDPKENWYREVKN
ncbi:hypothetical protein SCAR479_11438 [Seiridium cardinale]|uniref:NodB homology domain-containing protein n=1 Tax=Seiridium cardinale TaxID=138064 RepID=A0ABR2XDV5_9PEZI